MDEEPKSLADEVFDAAGQRFDFRATRYFLDQVADHGKEYAGLPMPFDGDSLVVHPKYAWAHIFDRKEPELTEPTDDEDRVNIVNQFVRGKHTYYILRTVRGKRALLFKTNAHTSVDLLFHTMGFCDAWEIVPESKAVEKLGSMVDHRQFRSYMLTGCFLERSKRSNVPYIFRRLRPTIALSAYSDVAKPLCTLCMHPIGYYRDSFAGAMVPTDDVIAHLTLMRGDEHEFWKQANQHVPFTPQSGL
jgi:hypothetical protein